MLGLVLLSTASSTLVFGLSELGTHSTLTAPSVVWPVAVAVVLSAIFIWHALRVERPLLDIRLYMNRVFGAASLTTFGLGAALFGAMILVPLYYQEVRHESVIVTGLLVGPQGLGMLMVMSLTGRMTQRFGGGRVALVGVSILCLGTVPLAFVGEHTSILLISLVLLVRGVGIGFSFMPAMTAAFSALRPDQLSDATPQLNVLQRIGGAIGTAVLAVVLQRAAGHSLVKPASAFATAYWWSLGIAVLSLIPCLVLLRAENPVRASRARRPTPSPRSSRSEPRPSDERLRNPRASGHSRAGARGGADRARPRLQASVPHPQSAARTRHPPHRRSEISHAQFELLIELQERGELSAGELASAARLAPGTVTQMLDGLAESGHVARARSESDRRVVVSRLTPLGRQQIEAKRAAWQARWEQALDGVSDRELRVARKVLERLGEMFEQAPVSQSCDSPESGALADGKSV